MRKQSRTVPRHRQSESPVPRHLPLVDILVDTQAELQELVVASGLKVLEAMLEEDRTAVCGPRYAHPPDRHASRAGHAPSEIVLGGRKVAIRRPRVRRDGEEVPLPTAQAFANADPLNRRVVNQMLIGVATRQSARSLEPEPGPGERGPVGIALGNRPAPEPAEVGMEPVGRGPAPDSSCPGPPARAPDGRHPGPRLLLDGLFDIVGRNQVKRLLGKRDRTAGRGWDLDGRQEGMGVQRELIGARHQVPADVAFEIPRRNLGERRSVGERAK